MRDLALIVSAIVLAIILIGIFSIATVFRTPQSQLGRAFTLFVNAAGVMAGTWFALLQIGFGARVIGGVVTLISAFSAIRVLRGMKN
jgi:hypothetical protein